MADKEKNIILLEREEIQGEDDTTMDKQMAKKKKIVKKTFLVDPSKDFHKGQHRNFIEYLASKTM